MDEDVIVVDDFEPTQQNYGRPHAQNDRTSQAYSSGTLDSNPSMSSRLRTRGSTNHSDAAYTPAMESTERTTRSAASKPKYQPKLKLKLSDKAAAQAPGTSFLGSYDRELDSDDEDLSFEEQFILRLPPGEDLEKLRKMVAAREVTNDVWFKFKDSRRGVFHIGNNLYSTKLVDLPCIIEAQKTLDNKQMFKIADICQMLVVEDKVADEANIASQKNFNIDEFIWPHGITPPLHHVRKRRFRKRVNRRTIESVEQEVERLLDEDAMATEVKYDVLDNVNPDLSDSEYIEQDVPLDAPTPAVSDMGEANQGDVGEPDEFEVQEENESDEEGDIDEELAAELDMALGEDLDENGGDEDEEEEEDSEEEEDDDEDDEDVQARRLLNEEIRDLEAAVAKKQHEITSSSNPLIRKRFEDALKKLTSDLDMKRLQRDEMREKQRMKKEGIEATGAESDGDQAGGDDGDDGDNDELFGPDEDDMRMDIG